MIRFKRRDNTTQVFSHRSYRLYMFLRKYVSGLSLIVIELSYTKVKKVAHPYEIQNKKVTFSIISYNIYDNP